MISAAKRSKFWIVILVLLFTAMAMLFMSYSQARRRADARIALMGIDTLFYRQHMILHGLENDKWPVPVWEVRYEVDLLSGFTAYVRISIFGEYVDSNTPDGPLLQGYTNGDAH